MLRQATSRLSDTLWCSDRLGACCSSSSCDKNILVARRRASTRQWATSDKAQAVGNTADTRTSNVKTLWESLTCTTVKYWTPVSPRELEVSTPNSVPCQIFQSRSICGQRNGAPHTLPGAADAYPNVVTLAPCAGMSTAVDLQRDLHTGPVPDRRTAHFLAAQRHHHGHSSSTWSHS
jgi:hypothetical protein